MPEKIRAYIATKGTQDEINSKIGAVSEQVAMVESILANSVNTVSGQQKVSFGPLPPITHQTANTVVVENFTAARNTEYEGYIKYNGDDEGRESPIVWFFISTVSEPSSVNSIFLRSCVGRVYSSLNNMQGFAPIKTSELQVGVTYYIHAYIDTNLTCTIDEIRLSSANEPVEGSMRLSVVKKTQEGYGSGAIEISSVNPAKCLVIINTKGQAECKDYLLTSNCLLLARNADITGKSNSFSREPYEATWRIVELF